MTKSKLNKSVSRFRSAEIGVENRKPSLTPGLEAPQKPDYPCIFHHLKIFWFFFEFRRVSELTKFRETDSNKLDLRSAVGWSNQGRGQHFEKKNLQLSSSPALQLSSVKRFAGLLLVLLIVLGTFFGLNVSQTATKSISTTATIGSDRAIDVFDAGIVFNDQPHYVCILLSRLGVSDSAEIDSIQSSCDCTVASIVAIRESATRTREAIRIDFKQGGSTERSSSLQVQFTINTWNGDSRNFAIRFLSTSQLTLGVCSGPG